MTLQSSYYVSSAFPDLKNSEFLTGDDTFDFTVAPFIKVQIEESSQRFTYGKATYESFSACHKDNGWLNWLGRKCTTLPLALFGLAKVIYHVAHLIFSCFAAPFVGNVTHIKADFFRIVRDLEEIVGRIWTFVHDKQGSFLVQESLFQKNCYDLFLARPQVDLIVYEGRNDYSDNQPPGKHITTLEEADEVTFYQLMNGIDDPMYKRNLIERFNYREAIEKFSDVESFLTDIERISEAKAKLMTMKNLREDSESVRFNLEDPSETSSDSDYDGLYSEETSSESYSSEMTLSFSDSL